LIYFSLETSPTTYVPNTLGDYWVYDVERTSPCEDGEKLKFKDQIEAKKSITILIGPEGDFSPKEIELALKHQYIPVSLGASRLRTETAGIVAGHTIQLCNE
jgi:RsmE family RNA methyltransferase